MTLVSAAAHRIWCVVTAVFTTRWKNSWRMPTGRPRALLFSTGFMANLGVVGALLDKPDAVFEDKLNHASLIDAGLASGARFRRYLHNDADSLAAQLARADARRKLVITDGVFSMDGDAAPLAALCDVADAHDAWMMVDDAHGFGVLGEQGVGTPAAQQVAARIPVYMATLGKALGTFGAFVAGSEALIETPDSICPALYLHHGDAAGCRGGNLEKPGDHAHGNLAPRKTGGADCSVPSWRPGAGLHTDGLPPRRSSRCLSATMRRRCNSADVCANRVFWCRPSARPPCRTAPRACG